MESLLTFGVNLIITAFAYLLVPTILCICRKELTLSRIRLIVIVNGICVWLIFMVIRINAGLDGTSAAVVLWSGIAYFLMKKCCLEIRHNNEPVEETVTEQDDWENTQEQQPRKKKTLVFVTIALSILLVVSAICNIVQYNYDETTFNSNLGNYTEKAEFLDDHIVFVIEGYGNYYYTYDEMMRVTEGKGRFTFWAYNKELAIYEGYIAAFSN